MGVSTSLCISKGKEITYHRDTASPTYIMAFTVHIVMIQSHLKYPPIDEWIEKIHTHEQWNIIQPQRRKPCHPQQNKWNWRTSMTQKDKFHKFSLIPGS